MRCETFDSEHIGQLDNDEVWPQRKAAEFTKQHLCHKTCYLVSSRYTVLWSSLSTSIRLQELQTAPVSPDLLAQQGLSWSKLPGNRHPLLKQASWK